MSEAEERAVASKAAPAQGDGQVRKAHAEAPEAIGSTAPASQRARHRLDSPASQRARHRLD